MQMLAIEQGLPYGFYIQFSFRVLEIMRDARCSLTSAEYDLFMKSVQKLLTEDVRV